MHNLMSPLFFLTTTVGEANLLSDRWIMSLPIIELRFLVELIYLPDLDH